MTKTILILGTHGQYNWGDDILLDTFLRQLGPEYDYYINSYDCVATEQTHQVNYRILRVFHTTKDILRLPKIILKSDLVFFAGGSIIRELYKSSGRNRYSSMLMVMGLVLFAKLIGRKKIIMSNIGVGPILSGPGRLLAKLTLSVADFVSFRDETSLKLAVACGAKNKNFKVVPDSVFVNPKEYFYPLSRNNGERQNKTVKVALNLNFNIANTANWEHFIETLAESFKILSKTLDIEIHGLPMQTGFNPNNDLVTLNGFVRLIPHIKFVEHTPRSSRDIGNIISDCDAVMAERYHALVISAIMGKPFLALEYDIKVQSLVKALAMSDFAVDINRPVSSSEIIAKFRALLGRRGIGELLAKKSEEFRTEAGVYFQDLKQFINS